MDFFKSNNSGCCPEDSQIENNERTITITGTPNVGKSVLFNLLGKSQQTVSNYPGTTVTVNRGTTRLKGKEFELIDTPGMYSLFAASEEEKVARNILAEKNPELVVHVVDGKSLKQSLNFTLQSPLQKLSPLDGGKHKGG